MVTKIDDIVVKFTKKDLPRIEWESDHKAINWMVQELYTNDTTLVTSLGEGAHGNIRLIMPDALYTRLTPTAYTTPLDSEFTAPAGRRQQNGNNSRKITTFGVAYLRTTQTWMPYC